MMNEIKDGYVTSHNEHGITTIEFFHPQSNSLPAKILELLAREIHSAENDNDTKVIILRSGGDGAFCAGASFDELTAINNETEGLKFFSGFANVINAMRKCKKIIIGRIQGKCVGGSVGFAAAVDYAIAVDKAEVKLSELAIGANLWRNAEWAKHKGLFAEVHSSIESMDESVYRLANSLSHSNPDAMAEMKKIFWKGTEHWDELLKERAAISGRLVLSEFTKNAINKFKTKNS